MHSDETDVPAALRRWFVVHFVADVVFALPLLVAPVAFGAALGAGPIEALTARLVGAALIGIGVESWLGRNASRASFRTMLRLKVLWSATATLGLVASVVEGRGPVAWALLAIFGSFCALWTWWWLRLRAPGTAG